MTLEVTGPVLPVVDTTSAAAALAAWVLDPGRVGPVVAVSVHPADPRPRVDTARLDEVVTAAGGTAYLVASTAASWELKRRLPSGLDVYGYAIRVWHPWRGAQAGPVEHPLVLLTEERSEDGTDWVDWVAEELAGGPLQHRAQTGVVTELGDAPVVRLPDGRPARLTAPAGGEVARLVRVAQTVPVELTGRDDRGRLVAQLVLPDPLARLQEQCPLGSTTMGVVAAVRSYGALVDLLPGLTGLLHVGELSPEWVRHPEDHLHVGMALRVQLLDFESSERVLLSRLHVAGTAIRPSLLRDGPAWVTEAEAEPDLDAAPAPPVADELAPWAGSWTDAPDEVASAPLRLDEQLHLLEDAVGRARDSAAERRRLNAESQRQLAELRSEAAGLVRELESSLAEARQRVLATLADQADDVLAGTRAEVDRARAEVARLQERLAGVAGERTELAARLEAESERAVHAEQRAARERGRADRARAEAGALRAELDRLVPEQDRLVAAIRRSWLAQTTQDDRTAHPWRDPVIGAEFLASLHDVEGISVERVHDVCAEVVCGRAATRPALGVHPLRAASSAGSPQLVREDGARAFRVSLQVRTAAARRLHYWELPDGGVELARIGYHDDFGI